VKGVLHDDVFIARDLCPSKSLRGG
jgi:hypothetical protein